MVKVSDNSALRICKSLVSNIHKICKEDNSLKFFNWALDKLTGVSTTTRHIKSPLLESLTEDAPFPLILKILPVCV